MKHIFKPLTREKLIEIFRNKLQIIRSNVYYKGFCILYQDFFYISVPNGDSQISSFKMINLLSEFPSMLKDFCIDNKISIKFHDKKVIFKLKK